MSGTLDYEKPAPAPKVLTLVVLDGSVSLIFPPLSLWMRRLNIAALIFYQTTAAANVAMFYRFYRKFSTLLGAPFPMPPALWIACIIEIAFLALVTLFVIVRIIDQHRYGHLPNILQAESGSLVWTRHWYWGMRDFRLPAEQVTEVAVRKVPDLFRRNRMFELIIKFKARRRFKRRFSTRETDMPSRIENVLKAVLTPRDPS